MRNLISNVSRHCPPGSRVAVELAATDARAVLTLSDTGPGIGETHRAQLNAGHTRLDRRTEGLGLGLAICQKIAEVHEASLTFHARSDGAPGVVVRVVFPLLRSP